MKWIKQKDTSWVGLACSGNPAYISEDGTLAITRMNSFFGSKTPWLLHEFREGHTYYLDHKIMENHGYTTMKEAMEAAEEYIKRKNKEEN